MFESRSPVDLRLAQTYIPALSCLGRATVLALILVKFPTNVPLLMTISTALYIDRSIRMETIFDSNAMLCVILGTQAVNLFRSDPLNHQLFLQVDSSQGNMHSSPAGLLARGILTITSACMLLGYDITSMCAKVLGCSNNTSQACATAAITSKVSTVVINGVSLICVMQTPLDRSSMSSPVQLLLRTGVFVVSSLVWTYAVGVSEMVLLLSTTSRTQSFFLNFHDEHDHENKKGNSKYASSPTIVQSFLPCHLRFTYLLLISGTHLYVCCLFTLGALTWIIYWCANQFTRQQQQQRLVHPEYCLADAEGADEKRCVSRDAVPAMYVTHSHPANESTGMTIAAAPIYSCSVHPTERAFPVPDPERGPATSGTATSEYNPAAMAMMVDQLPSPVLGSSRKRPLGQPQSDPVQIEFPVESSQKPAADDDMEELFRRAMKARPT